MSGYAIPPTPNRGGPISRPQQPGQLSRSDHPDFAESVFLAAQPGPGTARNEKISTVGCSGLDSQLLGTILKPFPTTFADLGPCPPADILARCHFIFFGFSATRQTAMPIRIVPRFCARGYRRFEKLLYGCRNPSRWDKTGVQPWHSTLAFSIGIQH